MAHSVYFRLLSLFSIPASGNRKYGLDILRAYAILSVMVGHTAEPLMPKSWHVVLWLFYDGVAIFFVLSGFLIGGILIKTVEQQPASWAVLLDFWKRRWIRTVPPYLLVLLCLFFWYWLQEKPDVTLGMTAKFLLFLQNLRNPHPFYFQEAWSLSVEEWFYLLTPTGIFITIRLLRLSPRRAVLLTALGVLVSVTLYRYYKFTFFPPQSVLEWDQHYRKIVITRLDALMYGVIGAYVQHYHGHLWRHTKTWTLSLGIIIYFISQIFTFSHTSIYGSVFSFIIPGLVTLLVLPAAGEMKPCRGVLYRTLTHISLISYSLYLLHLSVILTEILIPMARTYDFPAPVSLALFWVMSLGAATLMYKYFEVPVMRLRNRLKPLKQ